MDRTVKVWDAEAGKQLLTYKRHAGWNNVISVAFSPDVLLDDSGLPRITDFVTAWWLVSWEDVQAHRTTFPLH